MTPLVAAVAEKMMEYDRQDVRRINHFMKVYGYASVIGCMEGLDARTQETLELAALLHDIGIKRSEEKYQSSAGPYQELEGPPEAEKLLAEFSLDCSMTERICWLIGHHHTYTDIQGMDYQILVEADFLVNLEEDHVSTKGILRAEERIFRTESGKKLLHLLFCP
ncbi:MAG TPA: HD domain-containing protein [Candidatus Fusicatenibacter intestinigallinarum]|uniref:HD domain-containing protein n=1 Tax=Candidatus Fusicatenibacter intestinigallinarum TaxID=2838598 RepID=A0A9D2NBC6_9FIRM|nr:HD domain-containing protein [Candidatus Fusicatenibacter intestinigallinarum]